MSDLPGIAEAWHREALRRAEELDLGLVDTVSAEEVRCAVRKLLARPVGLTPEPAITASGAEILEP
ncbi:MAG: hypothetical protein V5B44_09845 [Candidatus Accumulibacter necessarius]|jgi:hypothetical protein|uniref:hypothetical protein n=1 Tax=Candidatus Accumulibacter necessarius TaxID=2954386 RepID=UPI002FC3DEC0